QYQHKTGRLSVPGRARKESGTWCGQISRETIAAGGRGLIVRYCDRGGSRQGGFGHEIVASLSRFVVRGRNNHIHRRHRRSRWLAVALLSIASGLFAAAGL